MYLCQANDSVFAWNVLLSKWMMDRCFSTKQIPLYLWVYFSRTVVSSSLAQSWPIQLTVHKFLGRLVQVDLIKWVSNVPSVRPSTKSLFDFNEIWFVGRGRWVMHDGMQYDPIQSQGHEPLKVGNLSAIFKGLSPPPFTKWPHSLKLGGNT